MGCQDNSFLLDGKKHTFPAVPAIVPYIVDYALSGRHKEVWSFNPSTLYGKPRALPVPASTKPAKIPPMTFPVTSQKQSYFVPALLVPVFAVLLDFYFNS